MDVKLNQPPKILGCRDCLEANPLDTPITMAFQPIIDARDRSIFAYEALVRGVTGESAFQILSKVTQDNRYTFDQTCRVRAIVLASRLGMSCKLSINFLPNAVYNPSTCIQATLQACKEFDFPSENIIFEVTEAEEIIDKQHLKNIFIEYKNRGFNTAIDDFGAGYAGLNLLVEFQPHVIKIDRQLIVNIDADKVRQSVLEGMLLVAKSMDITVIAEGIETEAEYVKLRAMGINLFQGYLFARPEVESLPQPHFPG